MCDLVIALKEQVRQEMVANHGVNYGGVFEAQEVSGILIIATYINRDHGVDARLYDVRFFTRHDLREIGRVKPQYRPRSWNFHTIYPKVEISSSIGGRITGKITVVENHYTGFHPRFGNQAETYAIAEEEFEFFK